jgi:hypothetical protein
MCFTHLARGQEEKNDTVLQGRICDIVIIKLLPLVNDSTLKENKYPIIYPLLIVNDVPIRDGKKVDYFRNHFDRTKIRRMKSISKAEAERKGISNVPKDGVLFVTLKRGYYFDFSCE